VLPAAYGGDRQSVLVVLAATGFVASLSALAGRTAATWWAVVALGAEYAVFVFGRDAVDIRAPLVGAALLVLAELVQWSLEARSPVRNDTGMSERRLVDLGVLWLGSLALGSLVVAAGAIRVRGGLVLTIVGVVGSITILGLIVLLASSRAGTKPQQTADEHGESA
jgi:hypothetical protein